MRGRGLYCDDRVRVIGGREGERRGSGRVEQEEEEGMWTNDDDPSVEGIFG